MDRDTQLLVAVESEKTGGSRVDPLFTIAGAARPKDMESFVGSSADVRSGDMRYRFAIHEINNLLGVINVYSELLGAGSLDVAQRRAANAIRDASARAGGVFRELLQLRMEETAESHPHPLPLVADKKASSGAAPPSTPRTLRILVVDDNRDIAMAWKTALELLGHDVRAAHDGPEAIRAAKTFKPNIAMLDLGLPLMSGYQVAQELLRLCEPANPISLVAVTGFGHETERKLSEEAGFAMHLVKPVDLNSLISVVRDLAG